MTTKSNTKFMTQIDICGIPCFADVISVSREDGMVYADFCVYDRKGYRAKWLEKKITKDIQYEIASKIESSYE